MPRYGGWSPSGIRRPKLLAAGAVQRHHAPIGCAQIKHVLTTSGVVVELGARVPVCGIGFM